jgi:hypothetical protein
MTEQNQNNQSPNKMKSVAVALIGIIAFIGAFVIVRYITSEGISAVSDGISKNKTEKVVTNYFTDTSTWKDFNSTLAGFKATFPAYPAHETEPIDFGGYSLNMEMYSAESQNGVFYAINFITYPNEVDTSVPENNLEGSVNGTLQSIDGELISSDFTYFGQHRAVEYLIHKKDGTAYVKGKNILVGQSMYQIVVAYEPADSSNVEFEKFADSFQLQ